MSNKPYETPSIPPKPSALKTDMADRKLNKARKVKERPMTMTKTTKPIYWAEVHPFIENIHALLTEYAHVGLLGNQHFELVAPEKQPSFIKNIAALYEDITSFTITLNQLRGTVKDSTEKVTEAEIAEFYDCYMALDALYADIATTIMPLAIAITEEITLTHEDNKDAA